MQYVRFKLDEDTETRSLVRPDGFNPMHMLMSTIGRLTNMSIIDTGFNHLSRNDCMWNFHNIKFVNCAFFDCDFSRAAFSSCSFENCENIGSTFPDGINVETNGTGVGPMKTNEEIEREFKCKCKTLQNKKFVKCIFTCDFCHKDTVAIYRRDDVRTPFMDVPNCDRKVCRDCYSSYNLSDKFYGHRHYGYAGPVSRYTTPIDKTNTVILGLEMEFEGDFYAWKELQDAHKGYLHYGYDSSVVGQNELSWDCGSYSWWKYIAPLKDVCETLKKGGGKAGDSAGIHIHASVPDLNMHTLAHKINQACRAGKWNALMKAVSLRNDRERFERYANLSADEAEHHAGISYNGHGTVEFRIFNSSVDNQLILRMIKFVKETVVMFTNSRKKTIYSPEVHAFIHKCAKTQLDKGFITTEEYNTVIKEF